MQRDSKQTVFSFLLSINAIFIVSYKITIQGGKHYDTKNIVIQFGNYTG